MLDGEWVESRPDAARLCQPCFLGFIFIGKMRLPERDMAHAANAVDQHLLRALGLQCGDLLRVGRQILFRCEITLVFRNSQLAERPVERVHHGILERSRVRRGQRVARGV